MPRTAWAQCTHRSCRFVFSCRGPPQCTHLILSYDLILSHLILFGLILSCIMLWKKYTFDVECDIFWRTPLLTCSDVLLVDFYVSIRSMENISHVYATQTIIENIIPTCAEFEDDLRTTASVPERTFCDCSNGTKGHEILLRRGGVGAACNRTSVHGHRTLALCGNSICFTTFKD